MLLKVGMAMMAVALAFTAVAAGIAVSLHDGWEPAIAAKPASNSAPELLGEGQSAPESEPLELQAEPEQKSQPELARESARESAHWSASGSAYRSARKSAREPGSERSPGQPLRAESSAESTPQSKSEPEPAREPNPAPEREVLPLPEDDWPAPTHEELHAINEPRHYELPASAIMGLTIEAIDLYNVPVFNDDSEEAFASGVVHEPETSLPWSNTPQRNVYLAAHRYGYYGTSSRLVFFRLNDLEKGDTIVLEDRSGRTYTYQVSEVFVVDPTDTSVMGQVLGRDMLSLQTCTPIPTFEKRLIVRADRI